MMIYTEKVIPFENRAGGKGTGILRIAMEDEQLEGRAKAIMSVTLHPVSYTHLNPCKSLHQSRNLLRGGRPETGCCHLVQIPLHRQTGTRRSACILYTSRCV